MSVFQKQFGCSRPSVVSALLIVACGTACCQSPASDPSQKSGVAPTSPEAVAASVWKKILTTCPVQGSGETTTFFTYAWFDQLYSTPREWRFEYREAWTRLFSRDLTAADKLNGLQFDGFAVLFGALYRFSAAGHWDPWKDGVGRNAADTLRPNWEGYSGVELLANHYQSVPPGFKLDLLWGVRVILVERGGRWRFGYVAPDGGTSEFDPDTVAAKKKSCDSLQN
jgi:hypothetical protein